MPRDRGTCSRSQAWDIGCGWSERRKKQRPGSLPGAVVLTCLLLRDRRAARAAHRCGCTNARPRVTLLVRQDAGCRHRELRRHILRQSAQRRQPTEAPVVWEALPLLIERERALQQQLADELRVVRWSWERDHGGADIRAAGLRAPRRQIRDRGRLLAREPLRLCAQQE